MEFTTLRKKATNYGNSMHCGRLEVKNFAPKRWYLRAMLPSESSLKLKTHGTKIKGIIKGSKINKTNTKIVSLDWIQDYNSNYTWNATESNAKDANFTVLPPANLSEKSEDNLILGYFKWYVLIILAVFTVLLLVITIIACYYDCENRRSTSSGGKYDSRRSEILMEAIRKEKQHKDVQTTKIQEDITEESSVHSRTLRKRKMLIAARRSASTKSYTSSEFGSGIGTRRRRRQLVRTKPIKMPVATKSAEICDELKQMPEMKSNGASGSFTGETSTIQMVSLKSDSSNSRNVKESITGHNDDNDNDDDDNNDVKEKI
uniref:Uncharacterized protein n=1 Tax=Setaria digitata TaxID=48799 RepID=A0A915PX00_9BILA